jgi:uncharacterized membrane protein
VLLSSLSLPSTFEPVLPWPWFWVLGACGLGATIVAAGVSRRRRFSPGARILSTLLQLLALAWVLIVLANPVRRGELPIPAPSGAQVVLLDTSASMSLGGAKPRWREGLEWAAPLLTEGGGRTRLVTFDRGCDLSGRVPTAATGTASRLSQAIERVLSQMGEAQPPHLIVVSDGLFDDPREIDRTLARLRERRIAVSTRLVGHDDVAPNLFIRRIDAPRFAPTESQVPIRIDVGVAGLPLGTPAMLRVLGEDHRILAERSWVPGRETEAVDLTISTGLRSEQLTAQLETVPGEISAADNRATFRIEPLHPKIRVFYAEGSKGQQTFGDGVLNPARFYPLAFQRAGDIEVDLFQMVEQDKRGQPLFYVSGFDEAGESILDHTRTIPSDREGWARYDVIIISDIDRQMFMPHMETVRQLVAESGAGFLMNGGNHSFDTGYYDQTIWEQLIPVDCFQFGYGHGARAIGVNFPAGARRHPILQFTPEPALNDRILDCHPRLRGYHDIRRVKPGATTLATVESNGAPLIAVQDYGRGRTMAFLSDPAGGWGEDYSGLWGPGLLAGQDSIDEVPGGRAFIEDASLAVNEFYNRFWVNSIRWLAGHSVRRQERPLLGRVASANARPSETLAVSAELRTGAMADEIAQWSVGVRADGGERVPLRFDRERNEFVGGVNVAAEHPAGEVTLVFDAQSKGQSLSDSVTVPVIRLESEFERTKPDAHFMEDIARAGGGQVLQTPAEARAVAEANIRTMSEVRIPFTQPLWDRAWFWALFIGIVGAKWWLWRRSSAAAAAAPESPVSSPRPTKRPLEEMAVRCLFALALAGATGEARAVESDSPPSVTKVARVCLIFGHPGDDEHRELHHGLRLQLTQTLYLRFGLNDQALSVFDSGKFTGKDLGSAPSARDELLALVREAASAARPDAAVWFIFIGHANRSRTGASFNLPGPDLTEKDLREALEEAKAQGPLVLICTQASSGRWVRALAGANRMVFAATQAYEIENETELPSALATALAAPGTDANGDGKITLLELFDACRKGVAAIYKKRNFVQVETPSLDANGDGRATARPAPEDAAAASQISIPIAAPTVNQNR